MTKEQRDIHTATRLTQLSCAKDLSEVLKEWDFTGNTKEYVFADQVCQLCGQKHLRYHYEIKNKLNGHELLVGSSCILNFDGIAVFDDNGHLLSGLKQRKKQLARKLKRAQAQAQAEAEAEAEEQDILEPIRNLWLLYKGNRSTVKGYVDRYKELGGFLPIDLCDLLCHLQLSNIQHDPRRYPVFLNSNEAKAQLVNLNELALDTIRESLAHTQKSLC